MDQSDIFAFTFIIIFTFTFTSFGVKKSVGGDAMRSDKKETSRIWPYRRESDYS